jgi:hypothetical protein
VHEGHAVGAGEGEHRQRLLGVRSLVPVRPRQDLRETCQGEHTRLSVPDLLHDGDVPQRDAEDTKV